jgi:hypothetical protein
LSEQSEQQPRGIEMNAIPYDTPEEDWDSYEDEQNVGLPGRPRRKFLTWWSAGLFALLLGLVGLYVGVRVEKNQLANSSSTSAFTAGTGAAATGTGAARRAGATGSGASSFARGAGGGAAGGSFRGLFGGAGAGGAAGSASVGTISSKSGNTLYVTETSGNTVKVTLSPATKVTKTVTVGKNAVRPGDLVVVSGAKGSNGTVSATTVNDTGASPLAAASGSSGSNSGSSASSAVGSLFGGG